jgi:hypothetical protein
MTNPLTAHGPDYNPDTWAGGYQTRQVGVAVDVLPASTTNAASPQYHEAPYPSVYSALANPPAGMTTAVEMALPAVPVITPEE